MTREEIISMAREVSDPDKVDPICSQEDFITLTPDELERFAALVAAHEREECAKVCNALRNSLAWEAAEDIRARSEK
jgi:hypothetical protein